MACKRKGGEPTYSVAIATNPNATRNPDTGEPVSKRAVYTVMRERCYDDDYHPDDTWQNQTRNSQTAVTEQSRSANSNFPGKKEAIKQNSWGTLHDNIVDSGGRLIGESTKG